MQLSLARYALAGPVLGGLCSILPFGRTTFGLLVRAVGTPEEGALRIERSRSDYSESIPVSESCLPQAILLSAASLGLRYRPPIKHARLRLAPIPISDRKFEMRGSDSRYGRGYDQGDL